jgi:hypothetical protein
MDMCKNYDMPGQFANALMRPSKKRAYKEVLAILDRHAEAEAASAEAEAASEYCNKYRKRARDEAIEDAEVVWDDSRFSLDEDENLAEL